MSRFTVICRIFFLFTLGILLLPVFVFASSDKTLEQVVSQEIINAIASPEGLLDKHPVHFTGVTSGLGADSVFAIFDRFGERLSLFFTWDDDRKLTKLDSYSHERLEELYLLLPEKNLSEEKVMNVLSNYSKNQSQMLQLMQKIQEGGGFSQQESFVQLVNIYKNTLMERLWILHNLIPMNSYQSLQGKLAQILESLNKTQSSKVLFLSKISKEDVENILTEIVNSEKEQNNDIVSGIPHMSFFEVLYYADTFELWEKLFLENSASDEVAIIDAVQSNLLKKLAYSLNTLYSQEKLQRVFELWFANSDFYSQHLYDTLEQLSRQDTPIQNLNFLHLQIVAQSRLNQVLFFMDEESKNQFLNDDYKAFASIDEKAFSRYDCLKDRKCSTPYIVDMVSKDISSIQSEMVISWYYQHIDALKESLSEKQKQVLISNLNLKASELEQARKKDAETEQLIVQQFSQDADLKQLLEKDNEKIRVMLLAHTDGYYEFIQNIQDLLSLHTNNEDFEVLRKQIREQLDNPPGLVNTVPLILDLQNILESVELTDSQKFEVNLFLKKLNEKVNIYGYQSILEQISIFVSELTDDIKSQVESILEDTGTVIEQDIGEDVSDSEEGTDEMSEKEAEIPADIPVDSSDIKFDDNTESEPNNIDEFLFE